MTRVLFYFFKNVHAPVLLPVYEELRKDPNVEIGFCLPFSDYQRNIRAGFKDGEEEQLRSQPVSFVERPQDFQSDVVFIADAVTELVQDCGKIINLGHGLLSKGQYFTDSKYIHRENLEHLLLVPGQYQREKLLDSGKVFIPVEAVGFPKLDKILKPGPPDRSQLCKAAGLDPSRKILLYAPTFNAELSAIPILWTRIKELATPDRYLLIKLHNSTIPEFEEAHVRLAENHENIRFIADLDITLYMQLADVMVSDVSSAWMEFALLDKPVVLFNNPNQREYANYDPQDIEYRWRDMGLQASTLEETITAVERSLNNPREFSNIRQQYREKLNIPMDGHASQRAVKAMWSLLEESVLSANPYSDEKTALLISGVSESSPEIRTHIDRLLSNCGMKAEAFIIGECDGLENRLTEYKYVCVVPFNTVAGERWLFRLVNHLRRNPGIDAVVPLLGNSSGVQDPRRYMDVAEEQFPTAIDLDRALKGALAAQCITVQDPPQSNVGVSRTDRPVCSALISSLSGAALNPFRQARLAMDVVTEFDESKVISIPCQQTDLKTGLEERIKRLAESIGSVVPVEDVESRKLRLRAEEIVGRMRYFIGRHNAPRALDAAKEALDVYPNCEPAKMVIESVRQSVRGGSGKDGE